MSVIEPDLSARPLQLSVERLMTASPPTLFQAWTAKFDLWFAAPGTLLMKPEVNVPYFFETRFESQRHPHYGRFLELQPDQLVRMTWLTGEGGTLGAETVVTVTLTSQESGTQLTLTHAGFPNQESRDKHEQAWPMVLEHLEQCLTEQS
jgi:uncharacterized protein YndB with AHSA1/START domain